MGEFLMVATVFLTVANLVPQLSQPRTTLRQCASCPYPFRDRAPTGALLREGCWCENPSVANRGGGEGRAIQCCLFSRPATRASRTRIASTNSLKASATSGGSSACSRISSIACSARFNWLVDMAGRVSCSFNKQRADRWFLLLAMKQPRLDWRGGRGFRLASAAPCDRSHSCIRTKIKNPKKWASHDF